MIFISKIEEIKMSVNRNLILGGGGSSKLSDSLILWYNIEKQGATNESMSLNPILKDLSGNGHDATCYNFSWAQMSGIGGFNFNFNQWSVPQQAIPPTTLEVTDHSVKMAGFQQDISLFEGTMKIDEETGTFHYPGMKIKVTGIEDCNISQLWLYGPGVAIYEDGIYEIPKKEIYPSGVVTKTLWLGFLLHFYDKDYTTPNTLTIEQLPYYPNAMISDGVDDYADVEINDVLSTSRGYTVIAKRKYTDEMINGTRYGSLITDNKTRFVSGAFSLEAMSPQVDDKYFAVSSFGVQNHNFERNQLLKDDIVYLKSNYYEGNLIQKGELTAGTDLLTLFRNVNVMSDHNGKYILYSLAVFDRDLTTYEIELAKALYL